MIYNFVNVVLYYDASNTETTHEATHVGPGKWKKVIQENAIDFLIPDCDSSGKGVVVGRFGVFPHKNAFINSNLELCSIRTRAEVSNVIVPITLEDSQCAQFVRVTCPVLQCVKSALPVTTTTSNRARLIHLFFILHNHCYPDLAI